METEERAEETAMRSSGILKQERDEAEEALGHGATDGAAGGGRHQRKRGTGVEGMARRRGRWW